MSGDRPPATRHVRLGAEMLRYGELEVGTWSANSLAAGLSVGADPASPSLAHKGDPEVPNEDALLVAEDGDRVLVAVADGHYGTGASHGLIQALDTGLDRIPGSPAALHALLGRLDMVPPAPDPRTGTTLACAVLRRDLGAGFGLSLGDSLCVHLGAGRDANPLAPLGRTYWRPGMSWASVRREARFFDFSLADGEVLLLCTDGVHECHYGHPQSSIGPRQLRRAFDETGADPASLVDRVGRWALEGRVGAPGGQDNIALVAVSGR